MLRAEVRKELDYIYVAVKARLCSLTLPDSLDYRFTRYVAPPKAQVPENNNEPTWLEQSPTGILQMRG